PRPPPHPPLFPYTTLFRSKAFRQGAEVSLAALAYRPAHRDGQDQVDAWAVPLRVGGTLPVLPLVLRGAGPVRLDLETTYSETRQDRKSTRLNSSHRTISYA